MPANIPTIQSPGVEIKEFDRSQRTPAPGGTTVYVNGFADQGPTDEVIGITSLSEFTNIYGNPKNAAERYFYHTVEALFRSTANVLVNRLPYGEGSGQGFGSKYTALVYPAVMYAPATYTEGEYETTVFDFYWNGGVKETTIFDFSSISNLDSLTASAVSITDIKQNKTYGVYWTYQVNIPSSPEVDALSAYINALPDGENYEFDQPRTSLADSIASFAEWLKTNTTLTVLSSTTSLSATQSNVGTVSQASSAVFVSYTTPIVGTAQTTLSSTALGVQADDNLLHFFWWGNTATAEIKALTGGSATRISHNLPVPALSSSTNAQLVNSINQILSNYVATTPTNTSITTVLDTKRPAILSPIGIGDNINIQNTPGVEPSDGMTTNFNNVSGTYFLGAPKQFVFNHETYINLIDGSLFDQGWSNIGAPIDQINDVTEIAKAGLVIVNKAQTITDQKYQGYYVGMVDNVDADNPGSDFNKVRNAFTVTTSAYATSVYTSIPSSNLTFKLTSTAFYRNNSISEQLELASNGYVIGNNNKFDDTLNVGVFKLRQSVYLNDPQQLIYNVEEKYTGSATDPLRQFASPTGGEPISYYLANKINNTSANIQILINPYINNTASDSIGKGSSFNTATSSVTLKKIRLLSQNLFTTLQTPTLSGYVGFEVPYSAVQQLTSDYGYADAIYPLGAFSDEGFVDKVIGELPAKINRSLEKIRNDEIYDVDILVEGGLGTINAWTETAHLSNYDDTAYNAAYFNSLAEIQHTSIVSSNTVVDNYNAVFSEFSKFACSYQDGGRGDLFFVADPLRHIFVTGANTKTINQPKKNFSQHIYWALRNLYSSSGANSSYIGVYANWIKVRDSFISDFVWIPSSGYAAARMASTDSLVGPWNAPAGYSRGVISEAIDIGVSPNQRQRDDLYKIAMNPIATFPGAGNIIFGQKTLQTTPSAFDRINVRRLFLYMEKAVKRAVKFFVFEPNTKYTRDRVKSTLDPFFQRIQVADGLYEYLIVCDERNNTPEVIDNNTLVVDIYLKPTRTAEFILVNFYATRTDTNFEELAGKL